MATRDRYYRLITIVMMLSWWLVLSACQGAAAPAATPIPTLAFGTPVILPYGQYTDISVDDLKGMLAHKDFVLINVTTPPDGVIAGTDLSIPYDQIDQNTSKLPGDKKALIVVYCRSGRPSGIASAALVKLGYTRVLNLVGGLDAWQKAGYTIVK